MISCACPRMYQEHLYCFQKSVVRSYTYTLLKDVKFGSVFNVLGVVKFFKEPTKTRGSGQYTDLSIIIVHLSLYSFAT